MLPDHARRGAETAQVHAFLMPELDDATAARAFFWGRIWTLIALRDVRRDFRMFRADRIARMAEAGPFEDRAGRTLRDFYAAERDCRTQDGPAPQ